MIAKVVAVLIGSEGVHTSHTVDKLLLAPDGIIGDRHRSEYKFAGAQERHIVPKGSYVKNMRQITIVSVEELHAIAESLGIKFIAASELSANILIEGIEDLTHLSTNYYMCFRGGRGSEINAVLRLMGENLPCIVAGGNVQEANQGQDVKSRFVKAAFGKRGQVAIIYSPGIIRPGDTVELIPHQPL